MPTKTQKKYVPGSLGKYFAMFVAPALIVYLVFSIVPFLFTIYYSFTDYTDMNPVNLHFTGLANYIKVLGSPLMRTAIKNSLIYAVVLTGAQVVLGLPLAVILNMKLRTRNLLRATFFFPAVFSSLIIGYLWNFILSSSNYGLINNLLAKVGLPTFNFFTSQNALYSVLLTQIWQWTGWAMVIFLANLQSISGDLYEAADVPLGQDRGCHRPDRRHEGIRCHLLDDQRRPRRCHPNRYDGHDAQGHLGRLLQSGRGVRRLLLRCRYDSECHHEHDYAEME